MADEQPFFAAVPAQLVQKMVGAEAAAVQNIDLAVGFQRVKKMIPVKHAVPRHAIKLCRSAAPAGADQLGRVAKRDHVASGADKAGENIERALPDGQHRRENDDVVVHLSDA